MPKLITYVAASITTLCFLIITTGNTGTRGVGDEFNIDRNNNRKIILTIPCHLYDKESSL